MEKGHDGGRKVCSRKKLDFDTFIFIYASIFLVCTPNLSNFSYFHWNLYIMHVFSCIKCVIFLKKIIENPWQSTYLFYIFYINIDLVKTRLIECEWLKEWFKQLKTLQHIKHMKGRNRYFNFLAYLFIFHIICFL